MTNLCIFFDEFGFSPEHRKDVMDTFANNESEWGRAEVAKLGNKEHLLTLLNDKEEPVRYIAKEHLEYWEQLIFSTELFNHHSVLNYIY